MPDRKSHESNSENLYLGGCLTVFIVSLFACLGYLIFGPNQLFKRDLMEIVLSIGLVMFFSLMIASISSIFIASFVGFVKEKVQYLRFIYPKLKLILLSKKSLIITISSIALISLVIWYVHYLEAKRSELLDKLNPQVGSALFEIKRSEDGNMSFPSNPVIKMNYIIWFYGDDIDQIIEPEYQRDFGGVKSFEYQSEINTLVLVKRNGQGLKIYEETVTKWKPKEIPNVEKYDLLLRSYELDVWLIDIETFSIIGHRKFPAPSLKREYINEEPIISDEHSMLKWIDQLRKAHN